MVSEHAPPALHSHLPDTQEPAWHAQSLEQSCDLQGTLQTPFTQFCPVGQVQVVLEHAPLSSHTQEPDAQEPAWHRQPLEQSGDVQTSWQKLFLQICPVGHLQVSSEHAPPALHSHLPDTQEPALHTHSLEKQSCDLQGPLQAPSIHCSPKLELQLQVVSEHLLPG